MKKIGFGGQGTVGIMSEVKSSVLAFSVRLNSHICVEATSRQLDISSSRKVLGRMVDTVVTGI